MEPGGGRGDRRCDGGPRPARRSTRSPRRAADIGADASLEARDPGASRRRGSTPGRPKQRRPGARLGYREEKGNAVSLLELPTGSTGSSGRPRCRCATSSPRSTSSSATRGRSAAIASRRGSRAEGGAARAGDRRRCRPRSSSARSPRHDREAQGAAARRRGAAEPAHVHVRRRLHRRPAELLRRRRRPRPVGRDEPGDRSPSPACSTRSRAAARRAGRASCARRPGSRRRERLRRLGVDGRPCLPVPALAALPAVPAARADRLRPVRAQAARLPAGPDPVRPPELQGTRQAARPSSRRASSSRARAATSTSSPGSSSPTPTRPCTGHPIADRLRDAGRAPAPRTSRSSARPAAGSATSRTRSARARFTPCRGVAAGIRTSGASTRLPRARAGDAPRRLEQLVPDHAVGPLAARCRQTRSSRSSPSTGRSSPRSRAARTSTSRSSSSAPIRALKDMDRDALWAAIQARKAGAAAVEAEIDLKGPGVGPAREPARALSPATSGLRRPRCPGLSATGSSPWAWPSACARSSP